MNNNAPNILYSMAFFDAQNLYRHAMEAFQESREDNYHHPNFDPIKLHKKVAEHYGFTPNQTRFYTGVPSQEEDKDGHGYWANRVMFLKRQGAQVETRPLRYRRAWINDEEYVSVPQEKGIDIRIALDLVRRTIRKEFDVAIIFSQDQDLFEATEEVKEIAREQGRFIKIVSAFPISSQSTTKRGIDKTNWFQMDKAFYDECIDPRDYRPKRT